MNSTQEGEWDSCSGTLVGTKSHAQTTPPHETKGLVVIECFLGYGKSAVLIVNKRYKALTLANKIFMKIYNNPRLLTQHNQGNTQWSPDSFPCGRVESGTRLPHS